MGLCWNCGNIRHKSAECNKRKGNEVEGGDNNGGGEEDEGKDAISVEIETVWNSCPVEVREERRLPQGVYQEQVDLCLGVWEKEPE
eukprot:12094463-Karenia_brevis.AAC.1